VAAAGVFGRTRTRSMSTLGLVGEKGQQSPANGTGQVTAGGPDTAGEATIYDQRLDPSSLFMRFDHQTGSSRMSVRSLRDDTDYSRRVLRVCSPTTFLRCFG
jgi:cell wall integrity and stress response component